MSALLALTAARIASRLNGEGARPPKHGGRYTRDGVRTLLSRWGVSTAEAPVGRLGAAEWWLPDLIRELGVDGRKMRSWGRRGWVHARRAPARRRWGVWADAAERVRLRQLLRQSRSGAKHHPAGLTSPKPRPGAEPRDG